jgi:Flp pilus assembly protein TadG
VIRTLAKSILSRVSGFTRCASGNISPLVVVLIIPILGVVALAAEVGNVSLEQRTQQHAADSAVLAAAQSNDATVDSGTTLTRYQRDAAAAAAKYPIGNATVTTGKVDCPGSASGANDCYQTTIVRTQKMYLAALVHMYSMTPTAIAVANLGSKENDCFVGTQNVPTDGLSPPGKGDGIYINGSGTGFQYCYLRSYGEVDCSGASITFKGVNALSQKCSAPFTYNPQPWTDPYDLAANDYKTAAAGVACSPNINSLVWSTAVGGTQYARVCSTSTTKLSANLDISSTTYNRVLYLDGVGLDLNGLTLGATNASTTTSSHTGTTIVATNSSGGGTLGTKDGSDYVIFDNTQQGGASAATLNLLAPGGSAGGSYANFVVIADPNIMPSNCQFDPSANKYQVNMNIVGVIYAPYCNIHMNGSNTSNIGTFNNCLSVIGNAIDSNGGKLTLANGSTDATSGCSAAGVTPPTDYFGRISLVK